MCLFLRDLNLTYIKFLTISVQKRVLEKLEMRQQHQVGIS
jgi:hypothetical protein